VKAYVRFEGARGSREGAALVDTGYSLTLLDAAIAAEVGAKLRGRTIKLAAADGHEVAGELEAGRVVRAMFLHAGDPGIRAGHREKRGGEARAPTATTSAARCHALRVKLI
jgi:hypothetical protein